MIIWNSFKVLDHDRFLDRLDRFFFLLKCLRSLNAAYGVLRIIMTQNFTITVKQVAH